MAKTRKKGVAPKLKRQWALWDDSAPDFLEIFKSKIAARARAHILYDTFGDRYTVVRVAIMPAAQDLAQRKANFREASAAMLTLRKYGQHLVTCRTRYIEVRGKTACAGHCDCGLREARAQAIDRAIAAGLLC